MAITYEQILNSPLITKSELARKMWPTNKNPDEKLSRKIAAKNGQRLTDQDKELIVKVFLNEFPGLLAAL